MSNSNHKIICSDCGHDQQVIEDAISNPASKPPEIVSAAPNRGAPLGGISIRLARTTPAPRGRRKTTSTYFAAVLYDETEFYNPYTKCPGDHQCVGCESDGA